MDEEENEQLSFPDWEENFSQPPKLCRVLKYDVVLPYSYSRLKDRLSTFETRDDDIWVITFPKSGTTWTQEIVSLIINGCNMDKNRVLMDQRFPFFEADLFYSTPIRPSENVIDWLNQAESPRLIKSHLPLHALPKKVDKRGCKIIYVARNPKDVMVSMYYFYKMLPSQGFIGEFSSFVSYFLQDKVIFSPYWKHVFSYWDARNQPNILFLHYEEMKCNYVKEIKKIAEFLGRPLDENGAKMVAEKCSFDAMKSNPATNKEYWKELGRWRTDGTDFMRKGEVGDWKNHFNAELNEQVDKWIISNTSDKDLQMHFSIE